jgi:hypothetical protein
MLRHFRPREHHHHRSTTRGNDGALPSTLSRPIFLFSQQNLMFTVHSKSRWARPRLKALSTQLLCLLFVGSSLSYAQDPEPTILKLQVLA